MNHISRKLCIALLGAAVLFAGCVKKPRPAPVDTTMMGPAASSAVNPEPGNLTGPVGGHPAAAAEDIIEDENTIRGLLKPVYFDFDRSAIKDDERAKSPTPPRTISKRTPSTGCCSKATATGAAPRSTTSASATAGPGGARSTCKISAFRPTSSRRSPRAA